MLTLYETCEDEWTVSLKSRALFLIANVGLPCQPEILPVLCLRLFLYFGKKKEHLLHPKMSSSGGIALLVCFVLLFVRPFCSIW